MTTHIGIPDERAAQLRELSRNTGRPMAELIADLIRAQIEQGRLSRQIPGLTVERDGERVAINAGSFNTRLDLGSAEAYAERVCAMMRPILTPAPGNPFMPALKLDAIRCGKGVRLIDRETGATKTIAPSIAEDFAENLRAAAR